MRWILFIPLLVLLALFALSNMQDVELRLWPFDLAWVAPLGVAALTLAGFGFLLGALLAWASGLPSRSRGRRAEEQAKRLEAELETYKLREEQARMAVLTGRAAAPADAVRLPAPGA